METMKNLTEEPAKLAKETKEAAPPAQGTPAQLPPAQLPAADDLLQEPAADPWRAGEQTASVAAIPALPPVFATGPAFPPTRLPAYNAFHHRDVEKRSK